MTYMNRIHKTAKNLYVLFANSISPAKSSEVRELYSESRSRLDTKDSNTTTISQHNNDTIIYTNTRNPVCDIELNSF